MALKKPVFNFGCKGKGVVAICQLKMALNN